MSVLTKPQGMIPIGWVTIQGKKLAVTAEIEWDRFFITLAERAGGVIGVSTTELVESAYEDAGINEMQALIFANEQGQSQRPVDIQANEYQDLRPAEIYMPSVEIDNTAELRARIDVLESMVKELQQVPT